MTTDLTRPVAQNPADRLWAAATTSAALTPVALLQAEAAQGRVQNSVYELYDEMLLKDGHLFSLLQTRANAVLGLPITVIPASDAPDDRAAATAATNMIARMRQFGALCRSLLTAIPRGLATVELLWSRNADGLLTVHDWIAHPPAAFAFDSAGQLLLLSPPFAAPEAGATTDAPTPDTSGRTPILPERFLPAPGRKFLVHTHGAAPSNPYGTGLCQHAYWYYWFKKNNIRFWALHNEKYGSPTAVATCPPEAPPEERQRLLDILRNLQVDAGVVLPQGITLTLLEAARTASGADSFRAFADWCNDEMSRIVLGATLTSGEGRRSGSLALGAIHELVRQDYIEADARALEDTLNATLFRWFTELNFATARPPRLVLDTRPPADLVAQVEVDRQLVALGVPLPLSYFHQRYGRPVPQPGDDRLRYDDANLFGYHLQYGILTVNEVRARLGLASVPWGAERANAFVASLRAPRPAAPAAIPPTDPDEAAPGREEADATQGESSAERAAESAPEREAPSP